MMVSLPPVARLLFLPTADCRRSGDHLQVLTTAGTLPLANHIAEVKRYYDQRNRSLCDAAAYCVERFVDAELDYCSPGLRGLGRMSEHVPRFAAKHRDAFTRLSASDIRKFRHAMSIHILCAHLYLDLICNLPPFDQTALTNNGLFQAWVTRIYQPPPGMRASELLDERNCGYAYSNVWFSAGVRRFHAATLDCGIEWDSGDTIASEQTLVTHYFTAGTMLRYTEAELGMITS